MVNISVLGMDLAKSIFKLHGNNIRGKVVFKKRVKRNRFANIIKELSPSIIAMEACGSANYWDKTSRRHFFNER